MIPHNKPCIDKKDAQMVYDTVMSNWIAYGNISKKVEERLSDIILGNSNRAVVCSSGSAALYLSLYAIGVSNGDEVVLPSYACTAVINAVYHMNAIPVLVDISIDNLSLTYDSIVEHINDKTKAIIVIHTYGIPCEIEEIKELQIPIIEDCSQSLGTYFSDGKITGSKGDIAIFSFYATKFLTGGYGGAVVSDNKELIDKVRDYIDFDQPTIFYPKFNFLLSGINASVILSQFDKFYKFLERRKYISKLYMEIIGDKIGYYNLKDGQNFYRFLLFYKEVEKLKEVETYLLSNGINVINPLANKELLHNYLHLRKDKFKVSEYISNRLLSLPIYPCLSEDDIEYIIKK